MKKITSSMYRTLFMVLFVFSGYFSSAQEVAINEVMSSNDSTIEDPDGNPSDWIEIYNYGSTVVNLGGYGITDDSAEPFKWVFPAYDLQPDEYIIVWASDKDISEIGQPFHTNFKISSGGEAILLTNAAGDLVDEAPEVGLETDVSYGRQPNGTGPWLFFYTPTPGASNTGTGLSELLVPPTFSHDSGLYTDAFSLSIMHSNTNAQIIYTTDGSDPTLENLSGSVFDYKNDYPYDVGEAVGPLLTDSYTSNTYNLEINVYDRSPDPEQLAAKSPFQQDYTPPANSIRKAFVVKARVYVDGIPSKVVSRTFFVWGGGNPYDIPVISIQLQENLMFGYEEGIYTAGIDFDTWRAENPDNTQPWRPDWNNYWRSGSDWEYPVNIEFFDPENGLNSVLSQNAGMRIHGNTSRSNAIKNLRFYARGEYDDQDIFEHDLFDSQIFAATVPDNNEYQRIMLRGNGGGGPVSYDVVFNRVMQPVFNGVTRIKPAIHFINGEYWGLTAMRDRIDEHHFALNFDLDDNNVAIIDCKGVNCELDEGEDEDYDSFIDMRNFIVDNDMSDATLYSQATDLLDMASYIDHMILEIYAANDSYERNFWKVRVPENDTFGDGRWRLTVQDFEASLKDNINWLEFRSNIANPPNNALFGNLLENEEFKIQFINRFADILNTVYTPEFFNSTVNTVFSEVAPYLAEDFARYPKEDFYEPGEQDALLDWGTTRPVIQQNQIKDHFSILEVLDFELNVSSTEAGSVIINTINIESATPGVVESPYPWTGQYFHDIPVTLQANAYPGFIFSHWSGDVSGTEPILVVTPTNDMQIQANFELIENFEEVVYFWLMDGEIENDTPLENMAVTYASNGLSANIIYSSCLVGYPFTSDHPNWRTASFERKNEPTALNYYPEANEGIPFESADMKGVQVRQPFKSGDLENTLEFQVPTTDFENIKFSFAVLENGAAETMLIDYWNGSEWTVENLDNSTQTITDEYQVMEFDFSNVAVADNNPDFMIRMRFDGADMFVDNGDEVIMNNIALTGESTLSTETFNELADIKVYPNPVNNLVKVQASVIVDRVVFYNIYGQVVHQFVPRNLTSEINVESFSTGIYLMKIISGNSEKTLKIIKK